MHAVACHNSAHTNHWLTCLLVVFVLLLGSRELRVDSQSKFLLFWLHTSWRLLLNSCCTVIQSHSTWIFMPAWLCVSQLPRSAGTCHSISAEVDPYKENGSMCVSSLIPSDLVLRHYYYLVSKFLLSVEARSGTLASTAFCKTWEYEYSVVYDTWKFKHRLHL